MTDECVIDKYLLTSNIPGLQRQLNAMNERIGVLEADLRCRGRGHDPE